MKRILVFFSVLLLFIAALANAPPVIYIGDNSQSEITITIDQPVILQDNILVIQTGEIVLPLMLSIQGIPAVTMVMYPGTLDVNYKYVSDNCLNQGDLWTNISQLWCEDYNITLQHLTHRLSLANNRVEAITVMKLSRLDIGEYLRI